MGVVRQAIRQLAKSPAYSAVAVLTLALGIGVNTTTFTVINALLLTPPRFEDPGRITYIYNVQPQSVFWGHSTGEAKAIHDLNSVFSQVAMLSWASPSLTEPGRPAERLTTMSVTPDFFPLLGTPPALGRWFSPAESNTTNVAVVSNRFWRARLAAAPDAIGRTLRLDGAPVTIVGVMPATLDDPISWGRVDLWTPLALGDKGWENWNSAWVKVMARLKPGVSMAQAQADMGVLSARLAHDHPAENKLTGLKVVPLMDVRIEGAGRRMSWLTMALTAFVLLIACVNLANLQLAQSMRRAREHAIRLALGCSRWRLAGQILAESLVLSLAGAALGFLVASWLTGALGHRIVIADEPGFGLPLDLRVAAFTLAAAFATAAAFGLAPAWAAARADAASALRSGGRAGTGDRSRHRLRKMLVISEVAASLVILSGAAYFVRGTLKLINRDFGWKPDNLLVGSISLPWSPYSDDDKSRAFARSLRTGLAGLPGVRGVTLSDGNPTESYAYVTDFTVEGRPVPQGKEPFAGFQVVQPGFFGVMGMRIVEGRDFTEADLRRSPRPILVNASAARVLWPGRSPVGRRLGVGPREARQYAEIIGVVNDITIPSEAFNQDNDLSSVGSSLRNQFYGLFDSSRNIVVSLRTSSDPNLIGDAVRVAVAAVDPNVAVYQLSTARQKISFFMANFTLVGQVLLGMAALGLLLAAVGIYGVISGLTEQRTREIGIRAALGAQRSEVLWLIMRTGMALSAAGCAIGLGLSLGLARILSRVMPEIPSGSGSLAIAMALLITAVALLASWLPARRAANVDPIEALRCE